MSEDRVTNLGAGSPEPEPVRTRGWVPVPDPTVLTTAQSNQLREDLRREIANLREIMAVRLDSMDKATALLESHVVACPSIQDIERLFDSSRALYIEKFDGISLRFTERDIRTQQADDASKLLLQQAALSQKTAIDAAFLANEKSAAAIAEANDKAIAKSEAATKEKIDGLQALLTGSINDIRGQLSIINSRLDRGESVSRGAAETRQEQRSNIGTVVGIASMSAMIVSMLVGGILYIVAHSGTVAQPTVVSPAVVPVQPR
jgi:hypothetical protein